jgi:serine/threonine protein kinase
LEEQKKTDSYSPSVIERTEPPVPSPPPANPAALPGTSTRFPQIEGYQFIEVLGRGGVGTVYKAKQILTGRYVAIKVLTSNLLDRSAHVRLQQEARVLCKLDHPNVVTIHDFGLTPEGFPFLIMQYISGSTLQDLIKLNGPLPWDAAVQMFVQICDALEQAHLQGVVHRDLKPSNVMVLKPGERDSQIKVLDFGIAKVRTDAQASLHLTATGEVFGSPLYMSPEQCSGEKTDNRTDIYSLGCLMYETLVGRPPHTGDNPYTLIMKHLNEKPLTLAQLDANLHLPNGLEAVIFRALEKNPDHRFQSMVELRAALTGLTDKRLLRRLHTAANLAKPRSITIDKRAIGAAAALTIALVSVALIRPHIASNSNVHSTSAAVKPEKAVAKGNTESKVSTAVKTGEASAEKAKATEKLEAQIAAALPVSNEDIAKAIDSAAILPDDVPVNVSRKQDDVTINTNRIQKTESDLKAAAILIASTVVKADHKVASVRVVFHYPEKPSAYDEVAFNREQLRHLAAGDLNSQRFLYSIKVLVSQSAKAIESKPLAGSQVPQEAAGTPAPDNRSASLPPAQTPERTPWRSPPPLTANGQKLQKYFPYQNPRYLDDLGQTFAVNKIPLPGDSPIFLDRRVRLAIHILSMKRRGLDVTAAENAYLTEEDAIQRGDYQDAMRRVFEEESALNLPPIHPKQRNAPTLLKDELRSL